MCLPLRSGKFCVGCCPTRRQPTPGGNQPKAAVTGRLPPHCRQARRLTASAAATGGEGQRPTPRSTVGEGAQAVLDTSQARRSPLGPVVGLSHFKTGRPHRLSGEVNQCLHLLDDSIAGLHTFPIPGLCLSPAVDTPFSRIVPTILRAANHMPLARLVSASHVWLLSIVLPICFSPKKVSPSSTGTKG